MYKSSRKSGKKLVNFKNILHSDFKNNIDNLKNSVNMFAEGFDFYQDID